jgi:integrase/recombinase XerD
MNDILGPVLFSFFEDHLKLQKGLRLSSIRSYRDTLRLFLQFVAQRQHRHLSRLVLADLTSDQVLQFLTYLEQERHNHRRTRNQRLAALHAFYEYAASRSPEFLHEAARVRAIPFKRVAPPETFYLERDEVMSVITSITGDGGQAKRDRALLTFLYNTGARVQEVVDLHCADVDLDKPFRVRLHGKGDKWRACPLWQETAALLRPLVVGRRQDAAVFTTRRQHPLTRFGIYKIVRRRTDQLLPPKQIGGQVRHVSPHILRHATAVSLLEGGAELNVIRAWLGHASLETTHRYAEINMRMKEAAMRLCEPSDQLSSSVTSHTGAVWRDDKMLLDWLRQL